MKGFTIYMYLYVCKNIFQGVFEAFNNIFSIIRKNFSIYLQIRTYY